MFDTLSAAASRYAELGYKVFPCRAGAKNPATKNGLLDATTDAAQIDKWWTAWPDANIGLATEGLVVIDLDVDDDGKPNRWLADQPEKLIDLACTPLSITPRGGRHYIFKQPANGGPFRNTAGKIAPHIDTRADGGYILVAPSKVDGKSYQWVGDMQLDGVASSLPEPPAWLLELLHGKQSGPSIRAEVAQQSNRIIEGSRNAALTSLAGTMRRVGMSQGEIVAALHRANADRCNPPLDGNEVEKIAWSVSRYEPDSIATAIAELPPAKPRKQDQHYRPELQRMDGVRCEAPSWLWHGRIALGKLTIVSGEPGTSKSTMAIDFTARVTNGALWPDGSGRAPKGGVVILNCEDGLADTVKPRLDAATADSSKVVALTAISCHDKDGDHQRTFDLTRDMPALETAIDSLEDCRLVIIDPVSAYCGSADSHVNAEVRAMLSPLADLAAKKQVAVVAISHLRKGEGQAIHRTMGSLAFVAAARAAYVVVRDKSDPSRRLFLPIKNNLGNDSTGLAYSLATRQLTDDAGNQFEVAYLVWESEPVTITADEAMTIEPAQPGPKPEERERAEYFIASTLADGPKPTREVEEEAKEVHGLSKRTIERARKTLGIIAFRQDGRGTWYIRLPDDTANDTDNAPVLGDLGYLVGLDDMNKSLEPVRQDPQDIRV